MKLFALALVGLVLCASLCLADEGGGDFATSTLEDTVVVYEDGSGCE